jgi:hypothetical protein
VPLTPSTNRLVTFSGGLSHRSSVKPWDLSHWNDTHGDHFVILGGSGSFGATVNRAGYEFHISGKELSEDALKRGIAFLLVFGMPPEGLDESLQYLGETFSFYRDAVQPAIESKPRHIVGNGRLVEKTDRAPFVLGT